ncbi:MAG: hypothetical protein IPL83_01295 [Bdellovibrionales bacterium]|nr:hypothetical protein [Bdellovibrionales bacterium]
MMNNLLAHGDSTKESADRGFEDRSDTSCRKFLGINPEPFRNRTEFTPYVLSLLSLHKEGVKLHTGAISSPTTPLISKVTEKYFGRSLSLQTIARQLRERFGLSYFDFLNEMGLDLEKVRSRKRKIDFAQLETALLSLDWEGYSLHLKNEEKTTSHRLSELLGQPFSLRSVNEQLGHFDVGLTDYLEYIGINPFKHSERGGSLVLAETLYGLSLIALNDAGIDIKRETLIKGGQTEFANTVHAIMGREMAESTFIHRIERDFGDYYGFLAKIGLHNFSSTHRQNHSRNPLEFDSRLMHPNSEPDTSLRSAQPQAPDTISWKIQRLLAHLKYRGGHLTSEFQPLINELSLWILGRPLALQTLIRYKKIMKIQIGDYPVSKVAAIYRQTPDSLFSKANMILYLKSQFLIGRFHQRLDPNEKITEIIFGAPYRHKYIVNQFISINKTTYEDLLKELDLFTKQFYLSPKLNHFSADQFVSFFRSVDHLDALYYTHWKFNRVKRVILKKIEDFFGYDFTPSQIVFYMERSGLGWNSFFDQNQIRHSGKYWPPTNLKQWSEEEFVVFFKKMGEEKPIYGPAWERNLLDYTELREIETFFGYPFQPSQIYNFMNHSFGWIRFFEKHNINYLKRTQHFFSFLPEEHVETEFVNDEGSAILLTSKNSCTPEKICEIEQLSNYYEVELSKKLTHLTPREQKLALSIIRFILEIDDEIDAHAIAMVLTKQYAQNIDSAEVEGILNLLSKLPGVREIIRESQN